nr:RIP metalloprotease RseP [Eubacterium sp.]
MNILIAVILFSAIILFHELGHFLLAKANKVGVIEFSLGMGPRIISYVKTGSGSHVKFFGSNEYFEENAEFEGHTIYSWKILPFGGSCMMLEEMEEIEDDRAFGKKSVWARMAVIVAGPLFNFILAFVFALVLIGFAGYDEPMIRNVQADMPMAEQGFQDGDQIKEINGRKIVLSRELMYYIQFHPLSDQPIELTAERDGKEFTAVVTPKLVTDEEGNEAYRLGFTYNNARTKGNVWNTLKYSVYEVKFWICTTIESLAQMITGKVSPKEVSGPVGIVQVVGNVVDASKSEGVGIVILNILNMGILLTANLGVMNLLPIPALDGGRLVFLIIEAIRRKPLPEKFENAVNVGGFLVLMGLMVVILANDIIKLIPH